MSNVIKVTGLVIMLCGIYNPIFAQSHCPASVDEAYNSLMYFLTNDHIQEDRAGIGLTNVSDNEITIMNDNQHSSACQSLKELHPFDQTRSSDEYPGPDKITYYKIRNLYLVVVNNYRFHEVDEDEIWVDMVPAIITVYNSDFERLNWFML